MSRQLNSVDHQKKTVLLSNKFVTINTFGLVWMATDWWGLVDDEIFKFFKFLEIRGNSEKYEFRIIFKSKLVSLLTKFTTNTVEISLHFFYTFTSSSQISSQITSWWRSRRNFSLEFRPWRSFSFFYATERKKREIKNRQQPGLAKKKVVTTHK